MANDRTSRGPDRTADGRSQTQNPVSGGMDDPSAMTGGDDRLRRGEPADRADRAMQDRAVTESRVLTDEDRLTLFRTSFTQAALPDLPRLPGWHVCWLSTTNPKDPIHFRQRIGYELIRSSDVPGYDAMKVQDGQPFAGYIMVGEMIAARIPMSLYNKYMREAHHDAPREEEERLRSAIDTIRQHAEGRGSTILEGDGMSDLAAPRPSNFGNPAIRNPEEEASFQ